MTAITTDRTLNCAETVQAEPVAVSIPEAALMLGVGTNKMYALAASDGFPSVRLGKRILIPVDGLRAWINRQAMVR